MAVDILKGDAFIITAPSGTGKTTLLKKLISEHGDYQFITSYTTRKKRESSEDSNYQFVSESEFRTLADQGKFLEFTESYGNLYGTPEIDAKELIKMGKTLFFEVEWRGARELKKRFPNIVHIYILPINREILRLRIFNRGAVATEEIDRRMKVAFEEMSHFVEADYVIFNDNFDKAYLELTSVIASEKLTVSYVSNNKAKQLEQLFNNTQ
ncbi:MAG: guanylate kinase [Methylacidiphilales bacterium]|nr:guanylate kinase [Candidatus Methylacidiphilales bacterium]